jgi:signal transduction histidine kinase
VREDVLARLYEAFFSTKAEGLGIGLALCRSIIESHRGRMKAQNLYNLDTVVGCRFAFTLPVELSAIRSETVGPSTLPAPLTSTAPQARATADPTP